MKEIKESAFGTGCAQKSKAIKFLLFPSFLRDNQSKIAWIQRKALAVTLSATSVGTPKALSVFSVISVWRCKGMTFGKRSCGFTRSLTDMDVLICSYLLSVMGMPCTGRSDALRELFRYFARVVPMPCIPVWKCLPWGVDDVRTSRRWRSFDSQCKVTTSAEGICSFLCPLVRFEYLCVYLTIPIILDSGQYWTVEL